MPLQVDNIILVLMRAEEFEGILSNKFGATGSGVGKLAYSVKYKIGTELTERLEWISGIRNKAAHEPSTFELHDPEKFIRRCDEAKEMLLYRIEISEAKQNPIQSVSAFIKLKVSESISESASHSHSTQNSSRSISFLFYAGLVMLLAVQFAHANGWTFPFFKSYEDACATSIFLTAIGGAHTSFMWQNGYLGFGLFFTTIGGFAWKYKWVMPIIGTYEIPLYAGILLILYAIAPKFMGIILAIAGGVLLSIELFLAFTQGLAAVQYGVALFAIALLGLCYLMMRRHKKISENGLFKLRK